MNNIANENYGQRMMTLPADILCRNLSVDDLAFLSSHLLVDGQCKNTLLCMTKLWLFICYEVFRSCSFI